MVTISCKKFVLLIFIGLLSISVSALTFTNSKNKDSDKAKIERLENKTLCLKHISNPKDIGYRFLVKSKKLDCSIYETTNTQEVVQSKAILVPVTSFDTDISLGITAAKQGDHSRAINFFKSSLEKNPNNAQGYYYLAKSLYKVGLNSESEQNYHKAIELNMNYPEAHNSLGILYTSQGNYKGAIGSYTRAISLNHNYSSPHINRGVVYFMERSYQKALFDFTRALEIEPKSSLALKNRANVYSKMGAKEAVCEDLRKLCILGSCASLNKLIGSGYCNN